MREQDPRRGIRSSKFCPSKLELDSTRLPCSEWQDVAHSPRKTFNTSAGPGLKAGQSSQGLVLLKDDVIMSEEDLEAIQLGQGPDLLGDVVRKLVQDLDLAVVPITHLLVGQGEVKCAEGEVDPTPNQPDHQHAEDARLQEGVNDHLLEDFGPH
ncbi:hypothetical protein OSTOST_23648, partial [Ostertagia ostertagi]